MRHKKLFYIKNIYLSLFIIFSITEVSAQDNVWPTQSAEWYYTYCGMMGCNKYTHYQIDRDTIINTNTYQIYSREEVQPSTSSSTTVSYFNNSAFIVGVVDSILIFYDPLTQVFDTLMNFKAEIGDTWLIYSNNQRFCIPSGDYLLTEVIGKTTESINGENLLKFTLRRNAPSWGTNFYIDTFYQKFGGIDYLFVPNTVCSYLDGEIEFGLRCFYQNTGMPNSFEYHGSLDSCDKLSLLGINESSLQNQIKIQYHQSNSKIELTNLPIGHNINFYIFDATGKILREENFMCSETKKNIIFSEREQGVYYVKVQIGSVFISSKIVAL